MESKGYISSKEIRNAAQLKSNNLRKRKPKFANNCLQQEYCCMIHNNVAFVQISATAASVDAPTSRKRDNESSAGSILLLRHIICTTARKHQILIK